MYIRQGKCDKTRCTCFVGVTVGLSVFVLVLSVTAGTHLCRSGGGSKRVLGHSYPCKLLLVDSEWYRILVSRHSPPLLHLMPRNQDWSVSQ